MSDSIPLYVYLCLFHLSVTSFINCFILILYLYLSDYLLHVVIKTVIVPILSVSWLVHLEFIVRDDVRV